MKSAPRDMELLGGPIDGMLVRLPADCRLYVAAHGNRWAVYRRTKSDKLRFIAIVDTVVDSFDDGNDNDNSNE